VCVIPLLNTFKLSEAAVSVAVFTGILQRRPEIIAGLVICGGESDNAKDFSPSTLTFPCECHSTIVSHSFAYCLHLLTELIK
jgi:hypothetical protein